MPPPPVLLVLVPFTVEAEPGRPLVLPQLCIVHGEFGGEGGPASGAAKVSCRVSWHVIGCWQAQVGSLPLTAI